jgi:hypothetical protein
MKNTNTVETVICDNLKCLKVMLPEDAITVTTDKFVEDDGSIGTFHFCSHRCFAESDHCVRTGRFCVPLKGGR